QDRRGQHGGDDEAAAQGGGLVGAVGRLLVGGRRRQRGGVARGRDRVEAVLGARGGGVVVDGGALGRVVDAGRHAVEPVEAALDAVRARGARHAGDRQLDVLDGGVGGHGGRLLRRRRSRPRRW